MSRWSSGWSRAVTNNAVPRSFLHLEVVSPLLQRLNLLALRLRQHNRYESYSLAKVVLSVSFVPPGAPL